MNEFFFTYGRAAEYPFCGGWTKVIAPDLKTAARIHMAFHPTGDGDHVVNCADYYTGEEFKRSKLFKNGNFGARCHEVIVAYSIQPDSEFGMGGF